MPAKSWQPLLAVLVVLGIPALAMAEWHLLSAQHPVTAVTLAVGWLAVCGGAAAIRKALAIPVQLRLEQAGTAADRVAACWLSGYGRRYRRWVLDSRRYIDVKDLATGGDHTPLLDDVFVDVALVRRAPHQISGNPIGEVAEDVTGRHSACEFLDRGVPVVLAIVGPPGCGKSTLLAYIARRTAGGRFLHRRVPVLITLREHAAAIVSDSRQTLCDITRSTVSNIGRKEPDGWWDRQFQRGRCRILLDGLDEVACDEDRRAVVRWVERQISSYPHNDFVITSRPHGFPGPVLAQADVLAIRPFTVEQVRLFLTRWYVATERHSTGAISEAEMRSVRMLASNSADRLMALLRASPSLNSLAVNPLLLTMIAMVHRYRGALPGSRADLYGEICQVMVSRRIQAKDLPELVPGQTKYKLLTALAYQMMARRVSELPARLALEILDPLMRRLPHTVSGQAFLDDVSHNGLLAESAPGRYAFAHLSFQEYLAARHISDNPSLAQTLVKAVDDHWWRESILLYAAIADADQVVRACLDTGTIRALTLAFDCAESRGELAPDLRWRLSQARNSAFTEDCDPLYRQLIAAVLAVRLSREVIITSAGSRICARPVPADLYWLFLRDCGGPEPDKPCGPDSDSPVIGMWGSDAVAFVRWLNEVTVGSSQIEFRLPETTELETERIADEIIGLLPGSVTGLWARHVGAAAAELWIPSGKSHPHEISGESIGQSVETHINNSVALSMIMAATTLDAILPILDRLIAMQLAVCAWARERDHVPTRALDEAIRVARDLARDLAAKLDRPISLGLDRPRALARALALNLDRALDYALDRAVALDMAIDHARSLALELDLDADRARARDFARALDSALARGYTRASRVAHVRGRDLTRAIGRTPGSDLDLDPDFNFSHEILINLRIRLFEIADVPLTWVARGALGDASHVTLALRSPGDPPGRIFSERLAALAGISAGTTVMAALGNSLAESLKHVSPAEAAHLPEVTSQRLAEAAIPLLERHHPTNAQAAGLRLIALALAADSAARDHKAQEVYQVLAATATLLQARAQDMAPIGEAIVLALA